MIVFVIIVSCIKKLFHLIPYSILTGLKSTSPDGSFTNGHTWAADFIASLGNEFTIKKIEHDWHLNGCDIADAIIDKNNHVQFAVEHYYNFTHATSSEFLHQEFIRNFTEGGLSAHDYYGKPSLNLRLFATRLMMSNLKEKRQLLFAEDIEKQTSKSDKQHTLTIIWAGANDLITLNKKPTIAEADKAVNAIKKHIRKMIQNDYRHFIVFNLPDLALTPRFHAKSKKAQQNASECCEHFNNQLLLACQELQEIHSDCMINTFDVDSEFKKVYYNPEKYSFDKKKLHIPYIKSQDFKMRKNGTSPAAGEMFFDEVHPTAEMHAILFVVIFKFIMKLYKYLPPNALFSSENRHHGLFDTSMKKMGAQQIQV